MLLPKKSGTNTAVPARFLSEELGSLERQENRDLRARFPHVKNLLTIRPDLLFCKSEKGESGKFVNPFGISHLGRNEES